MEVEPACKTCVVDNAKIIFKISRTYCSLGRGRYCGIMELECAQETCLVDNARIIITVREQEATSCFLVFNLCFCMV